MEKYMTLNGVVSYHWTWLSQETRQNSTSELTLIQKQIEAARNGQTEMQVKVKEIEEKIVQLEKKRDKVW